MVYNNTSRAHARLRRRRHHRPGNRGRRPETDLFLASVHMCIGAFVALLFGGAALLLAFAIPGFPALFAARIMLFAVPAVLICYAWGAWFCSASFERARSLKYRRPVASPHGDRATLMRSAGPVTFGPQEMLRVSRKLERSASRELVRPSKKVQEAARVDTEAEDRLRDIMQR